MLMQPLSQLIENLHYLTSMIIFIYVSYIKVLLHCSQMIALNTKVIIMLFSFKRNTLFLQRNHAKRKFQVSCFYKRISALLSVLPFSFKAMLSLIHKHVHTFIVFFVQDIQAQLII